MFYNRQIISNAFVDDLNKPHKASNSVKKSNIYYTVSQNVNEAVTVRLSLG